VLALTRVWWGPSRDQDSTLPKSIPLNRRIYSETPWEPFELRIAIVGLVTLLLVGGLWPDSLHMLQGGRP
jgi:hypothetical protein